jgi:hypothetical protein
MVHVTRGLLHNNTATVGGVAYVQSGSKLVLDAACHDTSTRACLNVRPMHAYQPASTPPMAE